MTSLLHLLPSLARRAVQWTARQYLPSWLVGSDSPQSHGSSRWARSSDRAQLGPTRLSDRLAGDGIAICF